MDGRGQKSSVDCAPTSKSGLRYFFNWCVRYLKGGALSRLVGSRFRHELAQGPDSSWPGLAGPEARVDARVDGLALPLVAVLVPVAALPVVGDVQRVEGVAVLNTVAALCGNIYKISSFFPEDYSSKDFLHIHVYSLSM